MQKTVHMIDVPAKHIPAIKYSLAKQAGIKQIILTTWGGLGDQVCAEPALRYAFTLFKDYKISLLTSFPELFTHLPFENIFKSGTPEAMSLNDDEWLILHTNHPNNCMTRDFITHNYTHCVDFSSLCAFQRQLPIKDRTIRLACDETDRVLQYGQGRIIIHAGRHWQSKTFPAQWWNKVIKLISDNYSGVVLVGKDVDQETGTVEVLENSNVIDLRNKLTLRQLAFLLAEAKIVVTNDSAPLHMATIGDAYILFIASCKQDDHLLHWRHSYFGYKMKNLGRDGLWNHQDSCPIREEPLSIDTISNSLLNNLLPAPEEVFRHVKITMGVL